MAVSAEHCSAEEKETLLDKGLKLFVLWPQTCLLIGILVQLALTGGSYATQSIAIDDRDGVWDVHSADLTKWMKALDGAQASVDPLYSEMRSVAVGNGANSSTNEAEEEEEVVKNETFYIYYKADNVFTPAALQEMCKLETTVIKAASSSNNVLSPLMLFYSSPISELQCEELSQSHVDSVVQTLHDGMRAQGSSFPYAMMLGSDFNATGINRAAFFSVKFPEVFMDDVLGSVKAYFTPALAYGFRHSPWTGDAEDRHLALGPLRVRFYHPKLWEDIVNALPVDMSFAGGAIMLVWFIMWMHTGSCFIASLGMMQIVLSLPISALFYRKVFMVDYFSFLHIMILYVVLGIGADDVFVLMDSWRHVNAETPMEVPGRLPPRELLKNLKMAYWRSASAVFNTSLTTSVAFMACSVSNIMPMRTMGWYAATCIVMNYLLLLSFLPAVLVVFHQRLEGKRAFCPGWAMRPVGKPAQAIKPLQGLAESRSDSQLSWVEHIMVRRYLPLMKWKYGSVPLFSLCVVAATTIVLIQGAYFTSTLTPPTKQEEWLPPWHMGNGLMDFRTSTFTSARHADMFKLDLIWGIKDLDMSDFNVYYPDDYQAVVDYDASFDLSTQEAQEAMIKFCKALPTIPCEEDACKNAGSGKLMYPTAEKPYTCVMEDFHDWLNGSTATGADFSTKLLEFRKSTADQQYKSPILAYEKKELIGFIGGKLRYIKVQLRTSVPSRTAFQAGMPVRQLIKDFVDKQREAMPASLKSLKFTSWTLARYDNGEELIAGFFQGCVIALPVCFLVLLVATMNIVTSSFALVAVSGVVLGVLGFCKSIMAYDLGMGEAIAGVIVIGYSVDYTVHLSHMYCEADHHGHTSRASRAEFAICNMGSTIFAGAGTTMAAGMVMFLCYVTFFTKMAVLITMTILFSVLFSLGFFVGMLFLAGPEGRCGNLLACMPGSSKVTGPKIVPGAEEILPASSQPPTGAAASNAADAPDFRVVGDGEMRSEDV